jgi:hypothetical protein
MLVNPAATLVAGAVSPEWYKLQAASPARDEAKMTLEITEDFFSAIRDNTPDIGAHEYSDTEPVTPPPPGSDPSSTFLPVVIR